MVGGGRFVEPLQLKLLVDDDEIDVVQAAQAVIRYRQQTVGIRRQIHPRYRALLRDNRVHEPRALMGESIVVVAPTGRRQQVVERRHWLAPRQTRRRLQPLDVLGGHRRHHQREGFIGSKYTVATGQQVAFEPTLAVVLAENFHHAAR